MFKLKGASIFLLCFTIGIGLFAQWFDKDGASTTEFSASAGDTNTLIASYGRWKNQKSSLQNTNILYLPLTYVKGLSDEHTNANGLAKFDLTEAILDVQVEGIDEQYEYQVWLTNVNQIKQNADIYVGNINLFGNNGFLNKKLDSHQLIDFTLRNIVIKKTGGTLTDSTLLFGSPTLFQKMFYNENRLLAKFPKTQSTQLNTEPMSQAFNLTFSFIIPKPALAQTTASTLDLTQLINQGEDLFNNEIFSGNGRTCATCHPATNNFTIDPAFISTLPSNDPLFVAEFNPDLTALEDPELMRQFGLIRANLDGFEDPTSKFVMRSVSHLLGLSLSIQSTSTEAPLQMTGWSGDGAPGTGTLRDFSTGAVTQHFTKTLNRIVDTDFRLPTDAELDALEAFMLSLGRQQEQDLNLLHLTNENAERGRMLFLAEDSQNKTVNAAKCNICHRNAGALTIANVNANFITGTENMAHAADLTGRLRPRDGGFGTELNTTTGGFGDDSFNTTSLWEAADTAPFFHHNASATLEESIAFYDSNEFKNSIEGQRLLLMDSGGQEMSIETDALAAFLRVINVLENIRSGRAYISRSIGLSKKSAKKLLKLAKADIIDAIQVLKQGELHENEVSDLKTIKSIINSAKDTSTQSSRDELLNQSIDMLSTIKSKMANVVSTEDITAPQIGFITPATGDTISGLSDMMTDAFDASGISSVTYKIGTATIGQSSISPFTVELDSLLFPDGLVQLNAIAVDNNANSTFVSIVINIENNTVIPVPDVTAPIITIVTPFDNQQISADQLISVEVFDESLINNVRIELDQTMLAQLTTSPFSISLNTQLFNDGLHSLKVTATDSQNNEGTRTIPVNIKNVFTCTVYSCPTPSPETNTPPPNQNAPVGSSPDSEFESELVAIDRETSTLTMIIDGTSTTLTITDETIFKGSFATNINTLLVGHIIQGEFFSSTNEIVWIEADLPPGL